RYIQNSDDYQNGIVLPNPKLVSNAKVGDTILIDVVVRISGINAVQSFGNFDAPTANFPDTRNDDSFQALVGAFKSVGRLKGDFDATDQGMANAFYPWSAPGSPNGIAQDFDSDGDLDLGALGTDPTNMWAVRAPSPQAATVSVRRLGNASSPIVTRF